MRKKGYKKDKANKKNYVKFNKFRKIANPIIFIIALKKTVILYLIWSKCRDNNERLFKEK